MRTKWFMLLTIAIFLVIFGRMVETPSLSKSAVVLGIGIDYDKAPRNSRSARNRFW